MKERNVVTIKLLTSHILLVPIVLTGILLFNIPWLPALLIAQTLLVILFFTGYWEFFSNKARLLIFLICELPILLVIPYKLSSENIISGEIIVFMALSMFECYLLFLLGKIIWVITKREKEKIEIEFPFQNGTYLITDGGNSRISRLMNYHFHSPVHKRKKTNRSMLYATDMVKLADNGRKFLPPKNADYPIFGENIYSPIDGTLVKVVNDLEDNIPFSGNYPYNTGNTVVIKNGSYYLLLGHLKKGSIVVKTGDTVSGKDLIGKAGNSGMSERPHLHMQLMKCEDANYWKGLGISMQFQEKNLYKNRRIKN
jgi:hypothetical protein